MRIGYTIKGKEEVARLKQEGRCERVLEPTTEHYLDEWLAVMSSVKGHELVMVNLESVGLQINRLGDSLKNELAEGTVRFHFLETAPISSAAYIALLIQLARQEKKIISQRTIVGLEEARRQGKTGGRPTVDTSLVVKMRYLKEQRLTIRAISERCGVSLGTVHKYVNLPEEQIQVLLGVEKKDRH